MLGKRATMILGAAGLVAASFWGCTVEDNGNGTGGGSTGTTSTVTVSTATGTTNPTTSSTGSGSSTWVGKSCTDDAQCGDAEGAKCIKSSDDEQLLSMDADEVGGPAGGYCSLNCTSHEDCPDGSSCVGTDGGICMLDCEFGAPELEFLDDPHIASKCQGRDDLMCVAYTGGSVCVPICGTNEECGSRECSWRSGLCVDSANTGDPLGAPCTPDVDGTPEDEDNCQGFCMSFVDENQQPTAQMCSARCSLGGDLATSQNCGGVQKGICVFRSGTSSTTGENGDFGFCTGACDSHDKCAYLDGLLCFDVGLLDQLGVGYCFGSTECPQGTECEADEICVQTKAGPRCVEDDPLNTGTPLIPLGEAGLGTGGAGGSGGAAAGGAGGAAAGGAGGAAMGGAGGAGGAGGGT